jgi:hypothetical protein
LQTQPHVSDQELDGRNTVISDFLLADKRFTAFVEIKKPSTTLFGKSISRSRSWRLSTELMESYSQILEQKASGQVRFERGELYGPKGEIITQRPHDAKVFLLIGSWAEIEDSTPEQKRIKERTLELFRRDSRNVELILFDELYDRAKFIVESDS